MTQMDHRVQWRRTACAEPSLPLLFTYLKPLPSSFYNVDPILNLFYPGLLCEKPRFLIRQALQLRTDVFPSLGNDSLLSDRGRRPLLYYTHKKLLKRQHSEEIWAHIHSFNLGPKWYRNNYVLLGLSPGALNRYSITADPHGHRSRNGRLNTGIENPIMCNSQNVTPLYLIRLSVNMMISTLRLFRLPWSLSFVGHLKRINHFL